MMLSESEVPENWDDEEWYDYEEYIQSLSPEDALKELQWVSFIAKMKKNGRTITPLESNYIM